MKVMGLLFAAWGAGLLLLGCGGGSAPKPAVSPLTGNWLLIGSLSNFGPTFPQGQPQAPFNLSVSLDVTGGVVTGYASTMFFCANSGAGGAGGLATAPIAADGSFELQPLMLGALVPTVTFDVHSVAPQTTGGTWSGTYTAMNGNNGCVPTSGEFTAVPIMPVTGTYSATGTLSLPGSSSSTPVNISSTLQQGATGSFTSTSTEFNSENVLNGTVTVQGSPCFSSGTIGPMEGAVIGSFVQMEYTMNDGSTLVVSGYINDTSASTIELLSVLVRGGQCNKAYGFLGTSLVRQG